ncbi:LOW QUALITY PROTEIN: P-selectin glycoprotein ligand 1 [Cygnus atratus]|uniref:LOW QUALITY PROTEIN: P-selectin glycoprotein ligand 1 n=1 Tax=Cygnus atratus TaxID=8868 RepID=UPI0021B82150|nr:LOW QUALITY PROTEIN: P-selectin glycoprotein ligand 1 [Cygnus atratus]
MKPPALSCPRWQRDILPPQGSETAAVFPARPGGEVQAGRSPRRPSGFARYRGCRALGGDGHRCCSSGSHSVPWQRSHGAGLGRAGGAGAEHPAGMRGPAPGAEGRRADNGQPPPGTAAMLGHGHATTAMPDSNETESLEPDLLLGSTLPPGLSTNSSLPQELTTLHTDLGETDSPKPNSLLPGTEPPLEAGTNASLHREMVLTTADPQDETDSPEPDLLLSSAPSTEAAPQNNSTAIPGWPMSSAGPGTEGTVAGGTDDVSSTGTTASSMDDIPTGSVAGGMDDISSTEPHSALPTTTAPTNIIYKKAGDPPVLNHPGEVTTAPSDSKPGGNTVEEAPAIPWDDSALMNKCLLAILLLALVAAAFMVCTGVLAALLCRRARTARHQFTPTEMVCISSLLPDGEPAAANGPRLGPHRHRKLLADGSSEADGDNLTLSSFLPEHS